MKFEELGIKVDQKKKYFDNAIDFLPKYCRHNYYAFYRNGRSGVLGNQWFDGFNAYRRAGDYVYSDNKLKRIIERVQGEYRALVVPKNIDAIVIVDARERKVVEIIENPVYKSFKKNKNSSVKEINRKAECLKSTMSS